MIGRRTAAEKLSILRRKAATASDRRWCSVLATNSMLYGASSFSDRCRSSADRDHRAHITLTLCTATTEKKSHPNELPYNPDRVTKGHAAVLK